MNTKTTITTTTNVTVERPGDLQVIQACRRHLDLCSRLAALIGYRTTGNNETISRTEIHEVAHANCSCGISTGEVEAAIAALIEDGLIMHIADTDDLALYDCYWRTGKAATITAILNEQQ